MLALYQSFLDDKITEDNIPDDVFEIKTLTGEELSRFLDLCFEVSELFSLTRHRFRKRSGSSLDMMLKTFLVKTVNVKEWFCIEAEVGTVEVQLFKADPAAKAILMRYFTDLFLSDMDSCGAPHEDLCFIAGNRFIMGSLSHEFYCVVNPPNESFAKQLTKIGRWIEISSDCVNLQLPFTMADNIE